MEASHFISVLATGTSLLITGIGFPIQIWKNYKRKDTFGISYLLFILSFLSYTLWSIRAYLIEDWYMFTAYTPGVFLSLIILYQIYFYRNIKIEQIINEAIENGKTGDLIKNNDIKKFIKTAPLKKALHWARKIDNNFEIWKIVLEERKVSFKELIECAEKYHHSIVWCIALERQDIQEYLKQLSTTEAIAYAEKSQREAVWEFMLKRKDVQEYLNKFVTMDAIIYARKMNIFALQNFFFKKSTDS